ncbi:hypothetical protein Zm00014a_043771 [Zea mays]|uniref:(+)-neomenthol dehydrogenase n=1 Tax=Zea mays TaxID=4577 RepID=A0A3L6FWF6_MAIZE|nr:hypothetical protein Zm00014a_043771 [Zea mays]
MTIVTQPYMFRVAVVTGGNKGIGLEVCRQLASRGVAVILTARDEKKGTEAVATLRGSGLPDVQFHRLDVSNPTGTARLAEFIKEKFGRLDILLVGKNAMERLQWLVQHSTESYEEARECLKINYFGTKYVTEALLPILISSSDGRLINVSSNYGLLQALILRWNGTTIFVIQFFVFVFQHFSGEDLKQELNDIDNLTVERLDEMPELRQVHVRFSIVVSLRRNEGIWHT